MSIIEQALKIANEMPNLGQQAVDGAHQQRIRVQICAGVGMLAVSALAGLLAAFRYYPKEIAARVNPPSPQPNVHNTQCAPCSNEDAKKLRQCELAKNLCDTSEVSAKNELQDCQKDLKNRTQQVEIQKGVLDRMTGSLNNTTKLMEKYKQKYNACQ